MSRGRTAACDFFFQGEGRRAGDERRGRVPLADLPGAETVGRGLDDGDEVRGGRAVAGVDEGPLLARLADSSAWCSGRSMSVFSGRKTGP
jgi:hypothetical protein